MWRQIIIVDKAAGLWPKTDEFVPLLSYFSANRMDTKSTGFVDYTHFPHPHLPGNRVCPFFGEPFPYSPMYNILLVKCKDKWATPRASEPSPGSFQIRGGGAGSCLPHHSWEPIRERGTKRSKRRNGEPRVWDSALWWHGESLVPVPEGLWPVGFPCKQLPDFSQSTPPHPPSSPFPKYVYLDLLSFASERILMVLCPLGHYLNYYSFVFISSEGKVCTSWGYWGLN